MAPMGYSAARAKPVHEKKRKDEYLVSDSFECYTVSCRNIVPCPYLEIRADGQADIYRRYTGSGP
jgi:hypothetical protein